MYTDRNFKKGKELKEAVALYLLSAAAGITGRPVTYYQPGPFGGGEQGKDAEFVVEGPHYPAPHSFYVKCVSRGGHIVWCNGLPNSLNPNGKKYNFTKGIADLRAKFPEIEAKVRATVDTIPRVAIP